MAKKDRQFSKSQAWLEWLSDSSSEEALNKPISNTGNDPKADTISPRPVRPVGRSLGLSSEAFSHRSATMPPRHSTTARNVHAMQNNVRTQPKQRQDDIEDTIAIRIDLPKFHLPSIKLPWKRIVGWGVILCVVAGLIIGTPRLLQYRSEHIKGQTGTTTQDKPAFAPLKPSTTTSVSGTSYDATRKLYTFNDKYLGRKLTINEQSLPESIRKTPSKLSEIAEKSIGAKDTFTTIYGTVYISTTDESGVQRMVFAHGQLLVFIGSTGGKLNDDQWVTYIQSFE